MEEEKKDNKGLKIILIFVLVVCLVGSCIFIYNRIYIGTNKEEEKKEEFQKDSFVYLDTSDYKYTLDVYKNKNSELCLSKDENCNEVAFSIKTETKSAKLLTFSLKKDLILYDDNGLKVYIVNLNKYQKIILENTYQVYDIYSNIDKDKVIGIVHRENEINNNTGYYNVLLDKKLYEGQYSNLSQINDDYLVTYDNINNKSTLLSSIEEKIVMKNKEDSNGFDIINISNNKFYIIETMGTGGMGGFGVNRIYNNDQKVIYENKKSIGNEDVSILKDNLYLKDDNKIMKYNINGDILLTTDTFKDLKSSILNYAVYVDNGKLLMQDVDTKDIIEITKWNDNYKYINFASQYYNKDDLYKYNREPGIYIVVQVGSGSDSSIKADVYHVDSNLKVNKITVEKLFESEFQGTYSYNYKKGE